MPKFYTAILAAIANFFGKEADDMTEAEAHDQLTKAGTMNDLRAAVRKEYEQQLAELETAQQEVVALKAEVSELKAMVESQKTRIAELEKEPAAAHTTGAKEVAAATEKIWMQDPINQRAMRINAGNK